MKSAAQHDSVKVAFDASALKTQYDHHGIQVYTRNLLAALLRMAGSNDIEIRPFLPQQKIPGLENLGQSRASLRANLL